MSMPLIETHPPSVLRFVALRRCVVDVRRAVAFYCEGLGFEIAGSEGALGETVLALGTERIVLVECEAGTAPPAVVGHNVRFQHLAIVASDMGAAFERLQKLAPVAISSCGPQRLPAASGSACAFKFRDPDGHPVELIEFPPGHSAAHWNAASRRTDGPTRGIDHAAISVFNADCSIAFYEQLGFRLGSRQINRGVEQARLDGLADSGVEVEVVALIPPQSVTPHLELLAYHTPKPTHGDVDGHATADRLVWQAHATRETFSPTLDRRQPVTVEDPDGHLNVLIVQ